MRILLSIKDEPLLEQFLHQFKKTPHRVYQRSSFQDELKKKDYDLAIIEDNPCNFVPALSCVWISEHQSTKHKTVSKPFSVADFLVSLDDDVIEKVLPNSVGFSISEMHRRVTVDGIAVHMTSKEFDVLRLIYNSQGVVISRADILETVWGMNSTTGVRSVDVTISRIRWKLGALGTNLACISRGGYAWREE